jgi:hypothetical protein
MTNPNNAPEGLGDQEGALDAAAQQAPPPTGEQSVFSDLREVAAAAVSAVELLRTVVLLRCDDIGDLQSGDAIPVSAVAKQHGIELTICHAGRLALGLSHLQQASQAASNTPPDSPSLEDERELFWLLGPARKPRSAIVGRALHELRAVQEDRAATLSAVGHRIHQRGPHHLRPQVAEVLRRIDHDPNVSKSIRALANLFGPALNYLGVRGLVALRAVKHGGGAYLIGNGIELFDGFPNWDREDVEAPKLPRPRS